METYLSVYLVSLTFMVVIITGIAVQAFAHWKTPGARTLGFLMTVVAIWAGFYLLEIVHPSLPVKIFARKMLYLGMTLSPPLWLGFALRYTGIDAWWSKHGRIFLLAIPGGVTFLLGATNDLHHLIWASLSPASSNPAPLKIQYGTGFWTYAAITYAMIAAGIIVHFVSHLKTGKTPRLKTGLMLTGVTLTAATSLFFLRFQDGISLDPTPLSFGLSAPLIALGFFRFGVSNLFPLAAAQVVDSLRDAIIIVNYRDEITGMNRAAEMLLGVGNTPEGVLVFSVLPCSEQLKEIWNSPRSALQVEIKQAKSIKYYEAQVILVEKAGEEPLGRVIVFHDLASEQSLLREEKRRSEQLFLLEKTGRLIADSLDEREILQHAVDSITWQFGYAETAISILTADSKLEVAAIAGADDFGYRPGFRQDMGEGIIGQTALLQKTYVTGNVAKDPHYFSTSARFGSAICAPIFKQNALFGVLYVESVEPDAFDNLDIVTLETLASQISASLQRAALYAQTQADLQTLAAIMEISRLVAGSLDLESISETVVNTLRDTFGQTHASIYFLEDEYLQLAAQVGYPETMVIEKIHISQGVTGRAVRSRAVQFIADTRRENTFLKADTLIVSEICVPLLKNDIVLGVLNVESSEPGKLSQNDVRILTAIAGPIAVACDNARLHAQLKKMATTDAVTGLSNRHVFEQSLQGEVSRAERTGALLSLIIFDVDFFKEYNDAWGHPAGDARLKAVADIIKLNLRSYDIAARYGGDEFAIILSDCGQQNALAFAQRLSQSVQEGAPQPPKEGQGEPGHTLSMGIATFPHDAVSPSELLIAADHAAMRAKQQGRNRIKLASDYETT